MKFESDLGSYEIIKDDANKKVTILLSGYLRESDFPNFLKDYEELKNEINIKETTLILDARKMNVFAPTLQYKLVDLYKDYTNFKQVIVKSTDLPAVILQLKRMLNSADLLDNFTFESSEK
jgi:hypothetical protein